jgi:hypothetical protein
MQYGIMIVEFGQQLQRCRSRGRLGEAGEGLRILLDLLARPVRDILDAFGFRGHDHIDEGDHRRGFFGVQILADLEHAGPIRQVVCLEIESVDRNVVTVADVT